MIFEQVRSIICKQLDLAEEEVTMDSYFIDDLGADSLDVMEMIMEFEGMFDIEVDEESLGNIKQVKDVVAYFEGADK
ncbi:MAG: acyl carrier protein [Eubacteriaceae bacterium]|nr:acyl carrier protein [Eubacteriaceae bacterium]